MHEMSQRIFEPRRSTDSSKELIAAGDAVLEAFTARFNARDLTGMDSLLHFPHLIYSGGELLVWQSPGQLSSSFFRDLADAGWAETVYESKTPVLVLRDKVHFRLVYSRRRGDESVLSMHQNLWIVTRVGGRWGIALRSY